MPTPYEYAEQHQAQFLEDLKALTRIPTVSTQPEHAADVQRAAEFLADEMRDIGLDSAEVIKLPEGTHPLVLGEWNGAGDDAPTVLIYCHYDVQPAAMEDGWDSHPYEPVEKDDYLYGRGVVDSKLHVIAQMKAVESILKTEGKLPVNLKMVLEGEEEFGSNNITAFVQQHPERLKADVCVISDGSIIDEKLPSLVYALRGIITFEVRVYGPITDLHSGHYGGNIHNPIQALTEILAQLHDDTGRVTVPGFYDEVQPLSDEERDLLKKVLPYAEAEWQKMANAPQPYGEPDYTLYERAGARPTLEINGIVGGYYGDGHKTVLPAQALAKISCRLVADQDPQTILKRIADYIAHITPPTVRSEVIALEVGAPAVVLNRESKAMQAAARAYQRGWGYEIAFGRAGGSVPITYDMLTVADDIVIMGFGFHTGRAHGPNENMHIPSLNKGIQTAIAFLEEIAQ